MLEALAAVSSYGYLIGILAFIIILIKAAVDFWFVTELEKILMTDYQKLIGFFSKLVLTIFPIVFITFIYIITTDQNFLMQEEAVDENLLLIVLLITIFLLNIFLHLAVLVIERIFNMKSIFLLKIDEEPWYIERLTKDNYLLLVNLNDEFLLIDDWKEIKIKKITNKNSYTFKIYSNKSIWITSLVVCVTTASLSILSWAITTNSVITTFSFFAACLSLIAIMIILANLFEYRKADF